MQKFKGEINRQGSKTVIELPFDPNQAWGQKSRHHIRGTVGEKFYRGQIIAIGDLYYLNLTPAWLRETELAVGDRVEVSLEAEGPQVDSLPDDIASALQAEPEAQVFFASLATFYRKGYLRWIDGASRRPEVRAERIQEMIGLLKEGKKQR